jgi:hypothetical protein
MTNQSFSPAAAQEGAFEVLKSSGGWLAIRQRSEGHVFTFFFNAAHTALARVEVTHSRQGRYAPSYFQEAAWRFADHFARAKGLIYATGKVA